jgi:hypothetical protein
MKISGFAFIRTQGDERLHDGSIPALRAVREGESNTPQVQSLLVDYTHFYGSFSTQVYPFDWTDDSRNLLILLRGEFFWEDVALLIKRCTGLTMAVHKNCRPIK